MFERLRQLPRPLAALYAGTIATRLGTFVVPYLTIYLSASRGLSPAAIGRIVAAGGVGLLLGNLLGGQLADRVGCKATLMAALFTNAVGVAVLAGSLPSGAAYATALAVALCGAGMYTPAASALVAELTSEAIRPFAFTVQYVAVNVGMGLGPLLGGLLASSSFALLFVGDIATSAVCMGLLAFGLRPSKARSTIQRPSAVSTVRIWAQHPALLAFGAGSIFVVAPLMGLEYAVPLLVGVTFQEPLVFVGVVYSINAACILALSFPIERALQGRNEVGMMALAALLWAAGLAILALGFSVGALLACTVVWTVGEIIASIVVPTYIAARVGSSVKGRMLALQDAVRSVSAIVCPLVLGAVWNAAGVGVVLVVLVVVPLIGLGLYTAWWRRGVRRRVPPTEGLACSR